MSLNVVSAERALVMKALPYLIGMVLLVLIAGSGAGGYLGWKLGNARALKAENSRLKDDLIDVQTMLDDMTETAMVFRQQAFDAATENELAAQRMNAIADDLESQRETNQKLLLQQRASLEELARRHPDLRTLDLGDDVLRHWNQSNKGTGSGTTKPATGNSGKPASAVPGASTGNIGDRAGAARESRRGHGSLPSMRGVQSIAHSRSSGVAQYGMAVVLQSGVGSRHQDCGVSS
ncbi:hypothetical protein [Pseudonocardia sp. TMWB2A]|uniref:hypothetical protein n=1 Tax=Pseudonocardia sp. TMWB2A TaxID=687430 RepID=UPI00307EB3B9